MKSVKEYINEANLDRKFYLVNTDSKKTIVKLRWNYIEEIRDNLTRININSTQWAYNEVKSATSSHQLLRLLEPIEDYQDTIVEYEKNPNNEDVVYKLKTIVKTLNGLGLWKWCENQIFFKNILKYAQKMLDILWAFLYFVFVNREH